MAGSPEEIMQSSFFPPNLASCIISCCMRNTVYTHLEAGPKRLFQESDKSKQKRKEKVYKEVLKTSKLHN